MFRKLTGVCEIKINSKNFFLGCGAETKDLILEAQKVRIRIYNEN